MPGHPGLRKNLPLYFPLNADFQIWQFVTSIFTHADTTHLLFNMFGLFSFGSLLERVWGSKRFLIFYFVVGIGAGVIYSTVNYVQYESIASELREHGVTQEVFDLMDEDDDLRAFASALETQHAEAIDEVGVEKIIKLMTTYRTPVVGASGAIYGILTAFGLLFPNAKLSLIFLPIPIAAKFFIPAILLLDLFSGVTGFSIFGGGIAHFAHLGGAFIGFLLMIIWRKHLSLPPELQYTE
ncbi:MAG: rhomboid family intramembrane serine protease [Verrucomicrobia bacterium]|nr:rhomboid family intramembrane serine protease [Verrucomicrobiota bacterium]